MPSQPLISAFLLQMVIAMLVTIWCFLNRSPTSQTCHQHKLSLTSVSNIVVIVGISDLLTGSMSKEFSLDDVQDRWWCWFGIGSPISQKVLIFEMIYLRWNRVRSIFQTTRSLYFIKVLHTLQVFSYKQLDLKFKIIVRRVARCRNWITALLRYKSGIKSLQMWLFQIELLRV